jgi:hypothetical protein
MSIINHLENSDMIKSKSNNGIDMYQKIIAVVMIIVISMMLKIVGSPNSKDINNSISSIKMNAIFLKV